MTQKNCHTGESKTGCNGEYLIYYEKKDDTSYFYNTNNNPTVEEFATNIKPGDLFAWYDAHIMIAYDVAINPNTNKLDVLLMEADHPLKNVNYNGKSGQIKSKIDPDKYGIGLLYYSNVPATNNSLIDLNASGSQMTNQGSINVRWLSSVIQFVNNGRISCKKDYCSVSRFFYKDGNNAKFNYTVKEQQIKNSMVRTKLPGIFIHKTADSFDNNSVYPDQTITYTIKIANQSNVNVKDGGKNYSKFYVSEVIPTDKVEFVSATNNGVYSNGKITWTINSLNAGSNTTLTYKVKVKNNDEVIGKKINAEGTVYTDNTGSITTGVVSNEVIRKPATKKDSYKNCYNKYKDSKKELELIDEVYKCAYDVDLKLTKFSVDGDDNNMFSKLMKYVENEAGKTGEIEIVNNENTKKYYDMILNDYWSSNILMCDNGGNLVCLDSDPRFYYISSWRGNNRADTIYKEHFKDGDVLIYYNDDTNTKNELKFTKEQGIYAYIYLNGKFVGQNQTGDAVRNEFNYQYYTEREDIGKANLTDIDFNNDELTFANYQTLFGKDYYVILRPEKIIQSNNVDIVVPDTGKTTSIIFTIVGGLIIVIGSVILIRKQKA